DFLAVLDAVAVGVGILWIGAEAGLLVVLQAVVVGVLARVVRIQRIGAVIDFRAVVDPIAVGIRLGGIGAEFGFLLVAQAVVVLVAPDHFDHEVLFGDFTARAAHGDGDAIGAVLRGRRLHQRRRVEHQLLSDQREQRRVSAGQR